MKEYDLLIIGAGPAGLFAAGECSSAGIKTALFDGMNSPGRKLLITGQGRCNLTNSAGLSDFIKHYGNKERFVRKSLYAWPPDDMIARLNSAGLYTVTRDDGKIFPKSEQSRDVLKCLLSMCNKSYIDIIYDSRITGVTHENGSFTVTTDDGRFSHAPKLLIATGGFTYPTTGSKGDGYRLAASLGHSIISPRPSLAALISSEQDFAVCAGISLEAETCLIRMDSKSLKHKGSVLFTHTGLSGPVIIDNSREMSPGEKIELNLLPELKENELVPMFMTWCAGSGRRGVKSFFTEQGLPDRLVEAVFSRCRIDSLKKAAEITKLERKSLLRAFTALEFSIERLDGKKKAMCTAGGVDTAELNPATMESRIIPGLYFAGEVIDVDGDSGGFNLQFAFSSAYAASQSVKKSFL